MGLEGLGNKYSLLKIDNKTATALAKETGTPKADDQVLDLQNLNDVENQQMDKVQFVKLKGVDGKDTFFSLKEIPQENRSDFLKGLQGKILNAKSEPNFKIADFVKMTSGDNIQIGKDSHTETVKIGSAVANAETVIQKSNSNEGDKWWKWANGGEKSVSAEGAAKKVGEQKKPGEWYNYISVPPKGEPQVYTSSSSGVQPPQKTVTKPEVENLIKENLNFNGAVTKINDISKSQGKEPSQLFFETLKANPKVDESFKNNPELLKNISQEIFSYANTGHATDGSIDIAKLQGMLKMVHEQIDATASSNTKFDMSSTIPSGDGRLGRATMLEMRHLVANINVESKDTKAENLQVKTPPPGIELIPEYPARVVIGFDVSGSMSSYPKKTIESLGDVVDSHPKHRIGIMKFDGNSDGGKGTILKAADNSVVKPDDIKDMAKKQVDKSSGFHRESSFEAAIQSIKEAFPATGDPKVDSLPKEVVIYSDEPDKSPKSLQSLIELAEKEKVKVTFKNPKNDKVITLDEIKEKVCTDGVFDKSKSKKFIIENEGQDAFNLFKLSKK